MDRRFFDGAATVRRLVRLHVAAGLAWSAMLPAYVQRDDFLRVPLLLSAAVLAAVILLVAFEAAGERLVTPLFVAAAVLLVTVAAYVWMRPGSGHAVGPPRAMHHFCDLTAEVIFVSVLLRLVVMPVIIGFRPRGGVRRSDGRCSPSCCSPSTTRLPGAGVDVTHWPGGRNYSFALHASEWLGGLIPVAGLALLRSGWRRPEARRWLGVLWDVGTFWPRAYHPFSPPCYAERAVPDLQRRIRWLNDCGDRVVVVGHSQGSVLTAVALAQRTEPKEHEQPLLVTFGCPLVKLYSWAFPAYINRTFLDRVSPWRNFSYLTDYIGGPVGRRDVDMRLPDPDSAWYITGEPLPDMRRHTGYWSDEAMWRQIDELCAQSAEPVAAAAPGAPA